MRPEAEAWFDRALLDLRQAELNIEQDELPGLAACHLQQALEKALKGRLAENASEVPDP